MESAMVSPHMHQEQRHEQLEAQRQAQAQMHQSMPLQPMPNMLTATPVKEIPPSLGFGSSSSPFFESPQTISRHERHNFQWSPGMLKQPDLQHGSSSFLLPSQFPPQGFTGLESSPPDVSRVNTISVAPEHNGSPKPVKMKRVGRRGRPRKYDIPSDPIDAPFNSSSQSAALCSTATKPHEIPPRPATVTLPAAPLPPRPTHRLAPPASLPQDPRSTSVPASSPVCPPNLVNILDPRSTAPSSAASAPVRPRKHRKRMSKSRLSVHTPHRTSNGMPLFNSRIFKLACKYQNKIHGSEASELRQNLTEQTAEGQRQYAIKGLGFNFSIDLGGKVNMETTTQVGTTNQLNSTEFPFSMDSLITDDSDSDMDEPFSADQTSQVKTPPRFSSLGSCDAATAFAKSLARTHDRGKGFMFLFPPVSTPDKHGQLSSFVPCTPRTPRVPMPFDETSFSMQMQTPPGAIFSYETPGGMYATGMTPFLGSARSSN